MLNRIRGLFQRYVQTHCRIDAPGFSLASADQPRLGHVDRVVLVGHRISFIGWSLADRITVIGSDGEASARPDIRRRDVAEALGDALEGGERVGFDITLPMGNGRFVLRCGRDGACYEFDVAPVTAKARNRAQRRLALRFARALVTASPAIVRALLFSDPAARDQVKRALGMTMIVESGPLDPQLFADPAPDAAAPAPLTEPVTLILPVYNAFDLLPEALERVVAHTDLPWRLILIEDCSSDPQVRPWLQDWVAGQDADQPGRVELLLNPENRGFIRSVNAALKRAAQIGDHVILLNSDAFVPTGWASRLMRPMLEQDNVATVTPMSNDAEIFSVPAICARTLLAPGQGDAIDALARQFDPLAGLADCPTGVGFCMAMNRDYLARIPALDTDFGRGYGEEVDWCQKARALGGRHLGVSNLFVEHRGGESFGSAEKQKLILRNNARIARRYPGYDAEVQGFIAADPLNTARLALAMVWAATRAEQSAETAIPVYLAHALGGGAENYLQGRIADDLRDSGLPAVVLRVGGAAARWQIELYSAPVSEEEGVIAISAGHSDDFEMVQRLLGLLGRRRIVYSCGVGDPDPVSLPEHLLALRQDVGDPVEVLVHDFFMLSPSYTLLNDDGAYTGPVPEDAPDKVHAGERPGGEMVSLAQWRAAWRPLLAAGEIVTFSADSADHMRAAFPDLEDRIVVKPHALLAEVPHILPQPARPGRPERVLGVLGNIGYQKGAAVVADLGQRIEADPELKARLGLVLLGNVDPAYAPPASVPVHGDYRLPELPGLVARYGITDWLIPSIWPETFSYTTHETLATGLPVHAFAIGAQGDAVAAARGGHAIPLAPGDDAAGNILKALEEAQRLEA